MVTKLYPVERWYPSDGVQLVEDVSDLYTRRADSEPPVGRGAWPRAAELVRAAALVVAVRRQRV